MSIPNRWHRWGRNPVATVAFNMRPVRGPWGGSSAFVTQMAAWLKQRGYRVTYDLKGRVDVIVLIDPRDDLQFKAFGLDQIRDYKRRNPGVRVLHRVNECDARKKTHFMDAKLAEGNELADVTVFISGWLRDHHAAAWFDAGRPHCAIYNGADPAVFHPVGSRSWRPGEPFRLVTHHWADNRIKGYDVYEAVDRLQQSGRLPGVQLVVIGRWPADVAWTCAETHAPLFGPALAAKLRGCHAYITASTWEPCGMHHVEGAQCGLPLLYHADGGGINEAGQLYGSLFRDDVGAAIQDFQQAYPEKRRAVLRDMPSGDRMCLEYLKVIQALLCVDR